MLSGFLAELKRRHVIRVAGVYTVAAWGVFQVVKTILDSSDLDACDDVDDAEYAFSESDTDGYGVTSWSAVYCLVGLGSYAAE